MSYGTVQAEKMTTESGYSLGAGNASSFKNRFINGAMRVAQRGTSITVANTGAYTLDQWRASNGTSTCVVSQSSTAPAGFTNSLLWTVSTTDNTANQSHALQGKIEGYNVADVGFGTASAKSITLSFWVYSSLVGTYGVGFSNAASNRSYVATYTINSANTWEQKTISLTADTSGTWNTTNDVGLEVIFDLGSGSDFNGTANAWQAGYFRRTSGCVNLANTSSATWYMTGAQLEVGTVATSFDYRPYGTELALCQRYYEKSYDISVAPNTVNSGNGLREMGTSSYSNNVVYNSIPFCVRKRATPTVTPISLLGVSGEWEYGRSGASSTAAVTTAVGVGETSFVVRCNVGAAWVVAYLNGHFTASAEL